ncbi:MAG: hypothetical protein H6714_06745 [Myxococcales bacterium]|nr:hypothetical protein [Myxococcales bacterium]
MAAHRALDQKLMPKALALLDEKLGEPLHLVIGGGAAMVLGYKHPLATQDVDAFAVKGNTVANLDETFKKVAKQLNIEPDWLNTHFVTFTYVLPQDYASRLRTVFQGKRLRADVLGPEDLLVMKCFAGRDKDRPHAVRLMGEAEDLVVVDRQLALLVEKRIPGAEQAADYFDDLRDEMEP